MQFRKLLLSISLLISSTACAKVHFDIAIMRDTKLMFQKAITLTLGEKPTKAYQDETTYIEAELLEENNLNPRIKLTVSTKSEHGMFLVRGVPEVYTNITSGLGLSSIACNSPQDNFVMLLAVSQAS